jgi:hypothetical protein
MGNKVDCPNELARTKAASADNANRGTNRKTETAELTTKRCPRISLRFCPDFRAKCLKLASAKSDKMERDLIQMGVDDGLSKSEK